VRIRKRHAVLNHIGTVHAIAMCNMAEVAAGIMTDVTIPATHRWIPKGMTVEYLKKAQSDLQAVAALEPVPAFTAAADLPVPVSVLDTTGQLVFRAVITMWVSPKKA
jgi:acyl-coenzyme A thioesterase PaaI-like protein